MPALELFTDLRTSGIVFIPWADHVRIAAPPGAPCPALLQELLDLLELYEERAAIVEYGAGLSHDAAEALAWECLVDHETTALSKVDTNRECLTRAFLWMGNLAAGVGALAHDERCSTMAWEQRGAHRYYYRSVRRHGHVTKDYLGTGPLAELAAADDTARQVQRQTAAEAWRQEQAALDALAQQLAAWWEASTVLLKATLYTEGYYQHARGPWRKRPPQG